MNGVDGVLLAALLLSAVIGLWRGLVYEVLSVAAWVAAFVAAQAYAGQAGAWLPMGEASPALRLAGGFAAVFIATAFAGGLLAWMVKRMVSAVGLRPIDRVLGAVFGLFRGGVILLALAVVVGMTPLHSNPQWQASVVAQTLAEGLVTLKPLLPESVARYLS
jgi:membrane protein required for colicin V production